MSVTSESSSLLKEISALETPDVPPMTISHVLVNDEFFGDYVFECNICDVGSGRAEYHILTAYALRHIMSTHPEVIVIESEEGISYV